MMLVSFWLQPQWLWLSFIFVAVTVVITAIQLSNYVAALAEKTKLGAVFLGAFLLSLVTSLPELISAITSSSLGNPILTFGNIFGANALTGTALAVIDLIYIKKRLFHDISEENKTIIVLVLFVNLAIITLTMMKISLPITIFGTEISLVFLLVFLLYYLVLYRLYKNQKVVITEEEAKQFEHLSLRQVLVRFFLFAVLLVSVSVLLTNLVNQMALPVSEGGYGLGSAVAGALFLSACTGLPEIVSAVQLSRLGQGNIAIGGIVGSHWFNFTIIAIGDIFFREQATFNLLFSNPIEWMQFQKLLVFGTIVSAFHFVNSNKKKIQNVYFYLLPSLAIVVIYLYGWFSNILLG